jgi:FkbH-like protein
MYESEVYPFKHVEKLPETVVESLVNTNNSITKRSLLHWTEHCTECAIPDCYSSCDFYTPRVDGKCQRFMNGIQAISTKNIATKILKIQFKKWGVLSSQGNAVLYNNGYIKNQERFDLIKSRAIKKLWPVALKRVAIQKIYSLKKNKIKRDQHTQREKPDSFLIECYNPNNRIITLDIIFRNDHPKYRVMPFQYKIELDQGYNKEIISFDEINKRIKIDLPYRISITPSNISKEEPLYFGITEFVKFSKAMNSSNSKKTRIKCVVWDLDNTLWNGILVEDGLEKISLKPGIKELIKELDNRGILQSISSKNDINFALDALKKVGLEEYFLYPQISWEPKSSAITQIANSLNIGIDSILFVDDSIFEREEVQSVHASLSVFDALEYQKLMELPQFSHGVTAESKNRRKLYTSDKSRKIQAENFKGDYFQFLKSCEIHLNILDFQPEHLDRVHELTQRTNQMNFSGQKYSLEDVKDLMMNDSFTKFVLHCRDNYGDYGIIGFAVINNKSNKLIDLMFSCRIQSKRIEHAFMTFCLENFLKNGDFYVEYIRTERNKFSAQVFNDFGFEEVAVNNNVRKLKFSKGIPVLNDSIISVNKV